MAYATGQWAVHGGALFSMARELQVAILPPVCVLVNFCLLQKALGQQQHLPVGSRRSETWFPQCGTHGKLVVCLRGAPSAKSVAQSCVTLQRLSS